MTHDTVWWSTLFCTLIFLYNGCIYFISVDKGYNGHYQDLWMSSLFIALASNYTYLFVARTYMYIDQEIYYGIISRVNYLPLAWVVFIIALGLAVHKTTEVNKQKKE